MTRSRGFTLLELLIGLTLLGFMLTLLFGGLRLAANSWNAVDDRAGRAADEEAGRTVIRRLVTHAQPLHLKRLVEQPLAFEGRREAMRMVAPLSEQVGLRTVELSVEADDQPDNPGGVKLVLRHGSIHYEVEQFVAALDGQPGHLLIGGLSEATFLYFGPEKRGDIPQWQEEWPNPDQFPTLVRLHLKPKNGTALDLDMMPMANGDRIATIRITPGPR